MRWVIIGSSGYIGGALCRYLLDRGFVVLSVSRRCEGPGRCTHHQVEQYSEENFLGLFKSGDRIVYAAGLSSISECRQYPELADRLNCHLPVALLKQADGAGAASFLYFSSVKAKSLSCESIGGEEAGQPAADPYGLGKWRAEQLLRAYSGRVRVNILRPAAVYGEYAGGRPEGGSMPNGRRAFIWKARMRQLGRWLPVVPATGYRSFVALEDLLAAITLLEERMCVGEIFIVAEPAFYDLAAIGSAVCGRRIKSSRFAAAFLMLPFRLLAALGAKTAFLDIQRSEFYSAERLKTRLDWRPQTRYSEFLRGN